MPRPKDYKMSDESKERTRQAHLRRTAWLNAYQEILDAANAGDKERATQLLNAWFARNRAPMRVMNMKRVRLWGRSWGFRSSTC
jgi:hypothetical protein